MEDKVPDLRPYIEPADLHGDQEFQKHYPSVRNKLENMLLWLQRKQSEKYAGDHEEVGRRVAVLNEVFDLLAKCSANQIRTTKDNQVKRLNRQYR